MPWKTEKTENGNKFLVALCCSLLAELFEFFTEEFLTVLLVGMSLISGLSSRAGSVTPVDQGEQEDPEDDELPIEEETGDETIEVKVRFRDEVR